MKMGLELEWKGRTGKDWRRWVNHLVSVAGGIKSKSVFVAKVVITNFVED
jgi:hypothetical protein